MSHPTLECCLANTCGHSVFVIECVKWIPLFVISPQDMHDFYHRRTQLKSWFCADDDEMLVPLVPMTLAHLCEYLLWCCHSWVLCHLTAPTPYSCFVVHMIFAKFVVSFILLLLLFLFFVFTNKWKCKQRHMNNSSGCNNNRTTTIWHKIMAYRHCHKMTLLWKSH